MLKKYYILLVFTLTTSIFLNAQCDNPDWDDLRASGHVFTAGEIVSDAGVDYEMIDASFSHIRPTAVFPSIWLVSSNPCAAPITTPVLTIVSTSGVWCRTAFANSNISSDGGAPVTQRGIVYATSPNPTIADFVSIDDATATGAYESLLQGLLPETTYYVRSYATNSAGTSYSAEDSFTTLADVDCGDCALACDKSAPSLYNPAIIPSIIGVNDTVCLTNNYSISVPITISGTMKLCNNAQVTLTGSINMVLGGQIIYEGCDEQFVGTGSYQGYVINNVGPGNDPQQMKSYCSSCDAGVKGQFLENLIAVDFWAATCRPTLTVLPVQLTTFTLSIIDKNSVSLNWTTSSEINNSHFLVETSLDGLNWSVIGLVEGAGNSTVQNDYSFIDNDLTGGVQYYRLQQVDFDGSFYYSNVRVLSADGSAPGLVLAYQNGNVIEVSVAYKGVGTVNLYDSRGRLVGTQSYMSEAREGVQLTFDAANKEAGIYYVHVNVGGKAISTKVLIK